VFDHLGLLAESQNSFTIKNILLRANTTQNIIFSKTFWQLEVLLKYQNIIPGNSTEHFYPNSIEKLTDACYFIFFTTKLSAFVTLTLHN
jgi:hypothetical protein